MSRYRTITICGVLAASLLLCSTEPQRSNGNDNTPKETVIAIDPDYQYPESYKDHVYTSLSQNARDLFFAVNIHPSCVAKKGQCIPRGKCIEKKMLYISRICYMRDLVCCYVDSVDNPTIEHITKYPPPTRKPVEPTL